MREMKKKCFVLFFLILLFCSCSTVFNEETESEIGGTMIWNYKSNNGIWSSPVYNNGIIYFGDDDGVFYALHSKTGEETWNFKTTGIIRCKAVVEDNCVFFVSDDGYLYALDQFSGKSKWSTDIGNNIRKSLPALTEYDYDYRQSSPVLIDNTLYIGSSDSYLYSIDSEDGSVRWKFDAGSSVRSTPLIHDGMVYIGTWGGSVFAIDMENGELKWEFETKGVNDVALNETINSDLAICDGNIIIGSRDTNIYAIDSKTGEQSWIYNFEDLSWIESSAVVVDDTIYIGSSDSSKLLSFDKSGNLLWSYDTGGWCWGTPFVYNNTVYIGSISAPTYEWSPALVSALHAVDQSTGSLKWTFEPEKISGYITGGIFSTPFVEDNILYFGSIDGNFYALE